MEKLFNFINKSISPFHGVLEIIRHLEENGYIGLKEASKFNLEANKGYYVVRDGASIIAFKTGSNPSSFHVVASHNDSPSYKLKPIFEYNVGAYKKANTEPYGGMISSTWFDRPLGVAGRMIIQDGENYLVVKQNDILAVIK